jgi:hypothetical protein
MATPESFDGAFHFSRLAVPRAIATATAVGCVGWNFPRADVNFSP